MSNYMDAIFHSYMETAMIVQETFSNLYERNVNNKPVLDIDMLYNETDLDTYNTLYEIAVRIEDENQRGDKEYTTEDTRERAEEEILKEYGRKEDKTYTVIETEADNHNGFKDKAKVIGQFNNRIDAKSMADKGYSTRRWIIEQ